MSTYDSLIDRANDAAALIPEDAAKEIIQSVPETSTCLKSFRRLPNMTRAQKRLPILSFLPTAYFVDGDTGLKQTTEQKWENKYIDAEELAVIVPIPEAVLEDVDYDIWAEVKPQLVSALGVAIDAAIYHGTNAPASWPDDILTASASAGNTVALGTGVDLYDDIFGVNGVYATVEADGFDIDSNIGAIILKARLRALRDANGNPIFKKAPQDKTRYVLDGNDVMFPKNGALDATAALLICGAGQEALYSIRRDITYKILTEAVIQDGAGDIIYNLAQQDMIALRVTMRLGWQVPNPINRLQQVEASRYPFGVLTP